MGNRNENDIFMHMTRGKIRHRKEDLEESKEKMEKAAFEVLKKNIPDEKEAKRIAVEISIIGTEEIELYAHAKIST
jgi:hypothetical protein